MENDKLSIISKSLEIIDNQLSIGNKILLSNNKKNKIIDFLINFTLENRIDSFNPYRNNNFNAFRFISNQYPLSYEIIEKYKKYLEFEHLSLNTKLDWFEGLIYKYIDSWDWKKLSSNTSLPWSVEFIERYEDYWDWEQLLSNEKLPWNEKFITKYKTKFLEKHNDVYLSSNNSLNWTPELITFFDKRISKESTILSNSKVCYGQFNTNGEKFTKIYYNIFWKHHIKITYPEDIVNYVDENEICWTCLCRQIKDVNIDFLENNNYRIDWKALAENEIALNEEIIDYFKDTFDICWISLSSNEFLPWSISFIKKFENYLDWEKLSNNKGIPWSFELIDTFIDKWTWKHYRSLSTNPSLPISIEFINKYKDYIDFKDLQYNNEADFWTDEFIETFDNLIEPWQISNNKGFPWSIKMIEKYKEYSCSDYIHPKVIDEILPYLDDETVIQIFDKIISR